MSPLRQPDAKELERAPTFTVRMRGVTVGWSSLEHLDEGMSLAHGAFRPGDGYDLVEPVFRLFAEAVGDPPREPADDAKLARYHAARDRLGLTLHAPNGSVVPTGFIPPGQKTRAVKGHEFGLRLDAKERGELLAFLRSL